MIHWVPPPTPLPACPPTSAFRQMFAIQCHALPSECISHILRVDLWRLIRQEVVHRWCDRDISPRTYRIHSNCFLYTLISGATSESRRALCAPFMRNVFIRIIIVCIIRTLYIVYIAAQCARIAGLIITEGIGFS